MPIADVTVVKPGDKVSYEDMANPFTVYDVFMTPDDLPNQWGYKQFRLKNTSTGEWTVTTINQHGWNHHQKRATV